MYRVSFLVLTFCVCSIDGAVVDFAGENNFDWYLSKANELSDIVRRSASPIHKKAARMRTVQETPEVTTSSGTVIGDTSPESHMFYSVPFGENPQRYMPAELAHDKGFINASVPNYAECYQGPAECEEGCEQKQTDDCLVLNVFVPSAVDLTDPTSSSLPVMVWLHGGAFFFGSGTNRIYDGRFFSNATNTLMVAINYRLDAFGFLVYEEGGTSFAGNQGIKDQQLAMHWVQQNIHNFGGNKNEVTLFGNSAGAQSVMLHLLSDVSKPLFKRGMMHSNPAVFYYYTPKEAMIITERLIMALNCTGSKLDCLLNASAEEIVSARPRIMAASGASGDIFGMVEPYRPVIDGVEFNEQPLDSFQKGHWQSSKEVVIGTLSDELGFIDALFSNFTIGEVVFRRLNGLILGDYYGPMVADKYKELANAGIRFDYTSTMADEVADMFFDCPSRALARFMSETTTMPQSPQVYLFVNGHAMDGEECYNNQQNNNICGLAFHGSDNYFVFGTGPLVGYNYNEADTKVVKQFSLYWGNFAHGGTPSAQTRIWPLYMKDTQNLGSIAGWSNIRIRAPESQVESEYREEYCNFWDTIGFYVNVTVPLNESTATSTIASTTAVSVTTLQLTTTTTGGSTSCYSTQFFLLSVCSLCTTYFTIL